MDYEASMHDVLERLLHDESAKPCALPLSLLRAITNNFNGAWEIGRGAFAAVYKVQYYVPIPNTLCLVIVGLKGCCDGRVCFEMEQSL